MIFKQNFIFLKSLRECNSPLFFHSTSTTKRILDKQWWLLETTQNSEHGTRTRALFWIGMRFSLKLNKGLNKFLGPLLDQNKRNFLAKRWWNFFHRIQVCCLWKKKWATHSYEMGEWWESPHKLVLTKD